MSASWDAPRWQAWLEQLDPVEYAAIATLAAAGIRFTPLDHPTDGAPPCPS